MRTRADVQSLLQSVLAHVQGGEAEARYAYEKLTATRFGENAITQNTAAASESVSIDVLYGRRRGSASTNKLDADALADLVHRADAIAREAPEDPEAVPLPGPQAYRDGAPSFFASTDALPPGRIAADIGLVVARAKAERLTASGLFQATTGIDGIANSNGLFGFDRKSYVDYSTTVHGANGSGKAVQNRNDYAAIDVGGLARTAVECAMLGQNPVALAPGDYTVIMEPLAVAEILAFLFFTMSAREAEEGTTPFAGTVGTRLLAEAVTLHLPVDDPDIPVAPHGEAGLAVRPTTWIEHGVVRRLFHSRYWAAQKGVEPDPTFFPLAMDGGDRSVADLVAQCRRGLLVKNLWYIRFVDRRTLMLTGMTRDGLFLVEDGRIVGPVKNMRWNESPITFLQNVTALSRPERIGGWGVFKVPAVMSNGFTFTSATDSV